MVQVANDGEAIEKLLQSRELNVIDNLCALMIYPVTKSFDIVFSVLHVILYALAVACV